MKAYLISLSEYGITALFVHDVGEDYDYAKGPYHEDNEALIDFSVGSNQTVVTPDHYLWDACVQLEQDEQAQEAQEAKAPHNPFASNLMP